MKPVPWNVYQNFAHVAESIRNVPVQAQLQATRLRDRAAQKREEAARTLSRSDEFRQVADKHKPFITTASADRDGFEKATQEAANLKAQADDLKAQADDLETRAAQADTNTARWEAHLGAVQRCTLLEDLDPLTIPADMELLKWHRQVFVDAQQAGVIPSEVTLMVPESEADEAVAQGWASASRMGQDAIQEANQMGASLRL
jgi:hypothetical protein